ncbi:NAD(P)/FAD-dependent oxidoreductase [Actinokineospora fastidiosa]|uniref:Oxidoreductase n=1 Tax=Actinokineospora fastidiosa TaxID=1816 RepID=A0A918LHR3_9PSEU|nr:FAD-dependent oxidoreductase [Actinokineospora fastidiosa]GGS49421.1 oxidoreductase [Actinokineospora fastidiosa]
MIVVLGAGYAGLMVANALGRKADVRLVNERDTFVERVRLHQLAAGQELVRRPLAKLLRGVGLEVGRVVALDPAARTVGLADGREVGYDTLVYALGSSGDLSTPGAAEHAYDVGVPADAARLRDRLAGGGTVAVVGGGLTGIETAAELARPDLKVVLLTDRLGAGLSEKGRAHVAAVFARLGVEVREGVAVERVRADGVELASGDHVTADAVAWTAGFRVPDLARDAGIEVDAVGRMVVDETLRSVSHPDVYGVGDAAAARMPGGQELRMACATGLPSAQHAARAILARRAGREPGALRFRYFNQCISLGRTDALIQFVDRDDTPRERILTGRLAVAYKEAIVRGVVVAERHPWIPTMI